MSIDKEELRRLWKEDPVTMPTSEIAQKFGVSKSCVHKVRCRMGLPPRQRRLRKNAPTSGTIDIPLLFKLWHEPAATMPAHEIAKRLGCKLSMLYTLKRIHKLPRRCYSERGAGVDHEMLKRLWLMPPNEMPSREIAVRLGISETLLYKIKDKLRLPPRERVYHCDAEDPTEDEIAERAAAIRASWPDGEEERRFVGRSRREWSIPSYIYDGRDCSYSGVL